MRLDDLIARVPAAAFGGSRDIASHRVRLPLRRCFLPVALSSVASRRNFLAVPSRVTKPPRSLPSAFIVLDPSSIGRQPWFRPIPPRSSWRVISRPLSLWPVPNQWHEAAPRRVIGRCRCRALRNRLVAFVDALYKAPATWLLLGESLCLCPVSLQQFKSNRQP